MVSAAMGWVRSSKEGRQGKGEQSPRHGSPAFKGLTQKDPENETKKENQTDREHWENLVTGLEGTICHKSCSMSNAAERSRKMKIVKCSPGSLLVFLAAWRSLVTLARGTPQTGKGESYVEWTEEWETRK